MNNYPIWWDRTVTIYNKYEDPQTQLISWYRTVVENCFWKYTGDKININNIMLETNNIICRIPEDERFLEKYEWINIPNDEMDKYFTLGPGDIIVRGEVDDVVNEYQSGKRSTDLLAKYKALQGCMIVETTAISVGPGRCDPHYYARGV